MKKMNRKGFTLVEVIAVVVIITVLSIILIPNVTKLINKEKNEARDSVEKTILTAAKSFVTDNRQNIEYDGSNKITSIDGVSPNINIYNVLLNRGYISATYNSSGKEGIVDPSDKSKCLSQSAEVKVTAVTEGNKIKKFNYEVDNFSFVPCSSLT